MKDSKSNAHRVREEYQTEQDNSTLAMLTPWEFKRKMKQHLSKVVGTTWGQFESFQDKKQLCEMIAYFLPNDKTPFPN